jgi:hypothetical protein
METCALTDREGDMIQQFKTDFEIYSCGNYNELPKVESFVRS